MTNEQTNPTGEPDDPADPVYPERYYEILARDLGEGKARWARLPYAERMRELAWYHAHFNTPDDLSPWPAEPAGTFQERECVRRALRNSKMTIGDDRHRHVDRSLVEQDVVRRHRREEPPVSLPGATHTSTAI